MRPRRVGSGVWRRGVGCCSWFAFQDGVESLPGDACGFGYGHFGVAGLQVLEHGLVSLFGEFVALGVELLDLFGEVP